MKFIGLARPLRMPCRGPACLLALLFAGCASQPVGQAMRRSPLQVRAALVRLMPAGLGAGASWATDIQIAFAAQRIEPTTANVCAVLAVAEQQSGFQVNPVVPGLGRLARRGIDRRAAAKPIPALLVDAALWLKSADGQRYSERLVAARTERQLSDIFQDFIGMMRLGKRLLGDLNPVHTAGPLQLEHRLRRGARARARAG